MERRTTHSRLTELTALLLGGLLPGALCAEVEATRIPDPLPLEWCLDAAARGNPDIEFEAAGAEAAAHRIRPAGSLEDPRFGYAAVNLPVSTFDFDSSPMSGHQLELRQKLPFPGLLSSRKAAARAASDAAHESLADRRWRVASEVERSWAALGFAQRALELTESNIDLLRQIAEIAEAKYRVGTGLQQDVLRAQVELTLLLEERLRRVATVRASAARLAALLDAPPATSFPRTDELADASALPALAPLLGRLPETSPRLRALSRQVEEAERAHRAMQLEGYPDVDLGLGYRIRSEAPGDPVSGDDFVSAGLVFRLPVDRGKWRERVAERAALLRRAKASYRSALVRLRDAVSSIHADLERADAEVALLETGLLPQTRQSLQSSRSGYRVDKVDFPSLVDSQVKLLEAQLSLVRAVADRRSAFAALEGAVGERLR
jgi:outer membrane protein TolC